MGGITKELDNPGNPVHVKSVLKDALPDEEVTLKRSLQWTER